MDGETLAQWVDARFATLTKLIELSDAQIEAIQSNRMTDLMRILSEKQRPIENLAGIATAMQPALQDDPNQRVWLDPAARDRTRNRQQHCDQLHEQLLEIETKCESLLVSSRSEMQERLDQINRGQQAATGYAKSQPKTASGGNLDLSSR